MSHFYHLLAGYRIFHNTKICKSQGGRQLSRHSVLSGLMNLHSGLYFWSMVILDCMGSNWLDTSLRHDRPHLPSSSTKEAKLWCLLFSPVVPCPLIKLNFLMVPGFKFSMWHVPDNVLLLSNILSTLSPYVTSALTSEGEFSV